jgi:hypothetical protein
MVVADGEADELDDVRGDGRRIVGAPCVSVVS